MYEAAGLPPDDVRERRATADYFVRQATDPDVLLAELDTPGAPPRVRRAACTATGSGARRTRSRADDVAFHDRAVRATPTKLPRELGRLRADAPGNRPMEDVPRLFERTPVPTLVLYGPEDHVVLPSFPWKAAAAFTDCIGPLFVPSAGHFLQWEAADTFNHALTAAFFLQLTARVYAASLDGAARRGTSPARRARARAPARRSGRPPAPVPNGTADRRRGRRGSSGSCTRR